MRRVMSIFIYFNIYIINGSKCVMETSWQQLYVPKMAAGLIQ